MKPCSDLGAAAARGRRLALDQVPASLGSRRFSEKPPEVAEVAYAAAMNPVAGQGWVTGSRSAGGDSLCLSVLCQCWRRWAHI